jgi:hypothetical protein
MALRMYPVGSHPPIERLIRLNLAFNILSSFVDQLVCTS